MTCSIHGPHTIMTVSHYIVYNTVDLSMSIDTPGNTAGNIQVRFTMYRCRVGQGVVCVTKGVENCVCHQGAPLQTAEQGMNLHTRVSFIG